jgi:lipopolysaccharide export system protein LptC
MAYQQASLRSTLSLLLPLVLLAGLAAGSYWLLQISLPSNQGAEDLPKTHTEDAFSTDLSVTMLDPTGITHYRLNAATMKHYEDDASSYVTLPKLRAFAPGDPDVTAYSETGTMNGDQSIVDLYDQARLTRDPNQVDPPMEADSQHFHILVNDDIIQSEKPVKLQRGQSVMYGNSMDYHNATRQMYLYGDVHGQIAAHEPPPTPTPSH